MLNSESDVRYNALNVNKVLDNMDEKQVRFKPKALQLIMY